MADNHVKPTQEELEAKSLELLEEAEKIEEKQVEEVDEVVEEVDESDEEAEEESQEETEDESEEEKPIKIQQEPEQDDEEPEPQNDYKERYIQSTREAQILYHKNKKILDAMDEANSVAEPTEKELQKEYSDWDIMSDFEKRMAKESMINSRRFNAINEISEDFKRADQWNSTVEKFLDDPANLNKNPALEGKEEEFKTFANKPTRRGLDMDDLIASFLYKADQAKPKPKKGSQLLSKSISQKSKPKSNKLSVEQARNLRSRDYNKWKQMLKEGKIESV